MDKDFWRVIVWPDDSGRHGLMILRGFGFGLAQTSSAMRKGTKDELRRGRRREEGCVT
jgi:hypothetical protein